MNPNGISETVTNNKRGRGRPNKYPPQAYEQFQNAGRHSRRTLQNHLNLLRAGQTLGAMGIDCNQFGLTTLAELGRVADPKAMARLAGEIHSRKLKGKQALRHIRKHRLPAAEPDPVRLGRSIAACIIHYRDRYPTLSESDVATAFRVASFAWKQ